MLSWYPFSFNTCLILVFSLCKSSLFVLIEFAVNKEETKLSVELTRWWELYCRYWSVCVGLLYTNIEISPIFCFNKVSRKTSSPSLSFFIGNSVLPQNWWCCHERPSIFNHNRNLYAGLWKYMNEYKFTNRWRYYWKTGVYSDLILLCKPKDRIATEDKNNMVYQIDCSNCEAVYFGESKHSLKSLSDEHKRSVRNCNYDKKKLQNIFGKYITTVAWADVQQGQSYLLGRRCLCSLGWPPF